MLGSTARSMGSPGRSLRVTFWKWLSGGGAAAGAACPVVARGRARRPETRVAAALPRAILRTIHLLHLSPSGESEMARQSRDVMRITSSNLRTFAGQLRKWWSARSRAPAYCSRTTGVGSASSCSTPPPRPRGGSRLGRQRPRRLPGGAVGDVLPRGGHRHRAAQHGGRDRAYGPGGGTAADEQDPSRIGPVGRERVEPVGQSAEHALDRRPGEVGGGRRRERQPLERAGRPGHVRRPLPLEPGDQHQATRARRGGQRQVGEARRGRPPPSGPPRRGPGPR